MKDARQVLAALRAAHDIRGEGIVFLCRWMDAVADALPTLIEVAEAAIAMRSVVYRVASPRKIDAFDAAIARLAEVPVDGK